MDLANVSERTNLKKNLLAHKMEGVIVWITNNRPKILMGLGVFLALVLISSVLILRRKEQNELAWTRLAQAQAYVGQRQWEGAKQILTDIKTNHPGSTPALFSSYYLGEVALSEKKYDDAIAAYSNVIAGAGNNPVKPLALVALGFVYEEKNDSAQAIQTYQQFLANYSDHFLAARTQLALGRVQLNRGDKEGGKKSLGQLVDLYPSSNWAKIARQLMDKS